MDYNVRPRNILALRQKIVAADFALCIAHANTLNKRDFAILLIQFKPQFPVHETDERQSDTNQNLSVIHP